MFHIHISACLSSKKEVTVKACSDCPGTKKHMYSNFPERTENSLQLTPHSVCSNIIITKAGGEAWEVVNPSDFRFQYSKIVK